MHGSVDHLIGRCCCCSVHRTFVLSCIAVVDIGACRTLGQAAGPGRCPTRLATSSHFLPYHLVFSCFGDDEDVAGVVFLSRRRWLLWPGFAHVYGQTTTHLRTCWPGDASSSWIGSHAGGLYVPNIYRSNACRLVRICRFHAHELLTCTIHPSRWKAITPNVGGKQLTIAFEIR